MQLPHPIRRKTQDDNVRCEVGHAIADERASQVQAMTGNRRIPGLVDRRTLKDGDADDGNHPGESDADDDPGDNAEVARGEDAIVHG